MYRIMLLSWIEGVRFVVPFYTIVTIIWLTLKSSFLNVKIESTKRKLNLSKIVSILRKNREHCDQQICAL